MSTGAAIVAGMPMNVNPVAMLDERINDIRMRTAAIVNEWILPNEAKLWNLGRNGEVSDHDRREARRGAQGAHRQERLRLAQGRQVLGLRGMSGSRGRRRPILPAPGHARRGVRRGGTLDIRTDHVLDASAFEALRIPEH